MPDVVNSSASLNLRDARECEEISIKARFQRVICRECDHGLALLHGLDRGLYVTSMMNVRISVRPGCARVKSGLGTRE